MHAPNPIDVAAQASGEPTFREIGVGPWAQTHPGEPRPDDAASPNYDARFDSALLDEGDRRNVLDRYRYWTVAAIKADLDSRGRHDFEVAVENWTHDFNIGSMVRTANAFQARRVHIVGPHKWNRKGALMTELYQHVENHPSITELVECWKLRIAGEIAAAQSQAAAIAMHMRASRFPERHPDLARATAMRMRSSVAASDGMQDRGLSATGTPLDTATQQFDSAHRPCAADTSAIGANASETLDITTSVSPSSSAPAGSSSSDAPVTLDTPNIADSMARLEELDAKIAELKAARVIALDIIPGAVPMETYRFPKRCLMLFGAEGPGLSEKALELADDVVYISQFGSVRSINAGAAAAVSMHAWIAQHAAPHA